jgi:hypothetical protein
MKLEPAAYLHDAGQGLRIRTPEQPLHLSGIVAGKLIHDLFDQLPERL